MISSDELLADLLEQLKTVPFRDNEKLDALRKRAEMIIRNIFGADSKYLSDIGRISFHPMVYPADQEYVRSSWMSGIAEFGNLLSTMREELQLFGIHNSPTTDTTERSGITPKSARVFVVHGHDEARKVSVARYLEKLGLAVTILHEQANSGRSIIEKFEEEASSAKFAVVLLTADDIGAKKDSDLAPRARQNVVFELGYFIGKIGRKNVVALCEGGIELPSDYSGVLYVELTPGDSWRLELAKEMKSAGIDIDLNRAIE
jgi:predicted nucleotide-binding protein